MMQATQKCMTAQIAASCITIGNTSVRHYNSNLNIKVPIPTQAFC